MNKKNLEKWNIILSKGKKNYIVKYGIIGWGVPTGLLVTIWNYIEEKPVDLLNFIVESSFILLTFPLMGIFFGMFMFSHIKNKVDGANANNQK